MPNWKKVITSGSDAILNQITSSGGINSTDITINDWGSVSASLASLDTLTYGDSDVKLKLNTEGVISGSTFSSPSQGTVRAQINGVNTDVDTGLQVADSPTFDSLTLTGDLTVLGTKTELQVTELNVEDKLIKVASGSANPAAANGAGIYIDGADVSLMWNHANGRFQFDDDLHTAATLNIGQVSNAGTDTDKFLVLDSSGNVDFRTGTEVLNDIGAGSSTNQIHPIQLTIDTKAITSGYIAWSALSDLQANADRAFTTWIAPSDGYLEKLIVSPEQTNTTTSNMRISLVSNGTVVHNTQSEAMGSAGTHTTFTFGQSNYNFTAGDRLSIEIDKLTNTADLYNVMVIFRLNS